VLTKIFQHCYEKVVVAQPCKVVVPRRCVFGVVLPARLTKRGQTQPPVHESHVDVVERVLRPEFRGDLFDAHSVPDPSVSLAGLLRHANECLSGRPEVPLNSRPVRQM
jgi:hypothetical protein